MKKHIKIEYETWKMLNEVGRKRETYDQIIRRSLKKNRMKV